MDRRKTLSLNNILTSKFYDFLPDFTISWTTFSVFTIFPAVHLHILDRNPRSTYALEIESTHRDYQKTPKPEKSESFKPAPAYESFEFEKALKKINARIPSRWNQSARASRFSRAVCARRPPCAHPTCPKQGCQPSDARTIRPFLQGCRDRSRRRGRRSASTPSGAKGA